MAIEDHIEHPTDPAAPKVLDLLKAQRLIAASEKFIRQPAGDFIKELADQLRLAVGEVQGTSSKIVNAQNEAIRYQRELETANAEIRNLQHLLVQAREPKPAAAKKKTTKAPIVPLPEQKAQ